MNFRQQAEQFMSEIATRRRNPAKANTLHVYRSLLDVRLLPLIGEKGLADINNQTAKWLVDRLSEAKLSPATINLAVVLMKRVVKSAIDSEGNPLYPRQWNSDFIQLPPVDQSLQKAPITPQKAILGALGATNGDVKALIAILAGTGLRIGETLVLTSGEDNGSDNFWHPESGTILVRATEVCGELQSSTKTTAGNRVVDLSPELNDFLKQTFPNHTGRLFQKSRSRYRQILIVAGIRGGFHGMRRFRETHLENNNVPRMMMKFWTGHAASDITERYIKVGAQIEERKAWSERAGLGFAL